MKRVLIPVILAAAILAAIAVACAPDFPKAVFSYARHPDFPRTDYLSGNLGVIQPSYARSYLVIAYRYLSGPMLSEVEQQQVREYWKDRETGEWDNTATDWVNMWEAERKRVPGGNPPPKDSVTGGRYAFDRQTNSFYLNCAEDAYRTAYETLRSRGAKFGIHSAPVRSWRDAQDMVFSYCGAGAAKLPAEAPADLPAVIRADREYQIAAAHFYASRYDEAEARFRRIAATPGSPWSWIAPYLVVRTLARAADVDPKVLPKAEVAAQEVLKDGKLVRLHGMTRVLLHRVIRKKRDEDYFHALAADLASGLAGRSFREELWDYTTLFDKFVGYDPWSRWQEEPKIIDPSIFARDDLSDWIFTFQRDDPKAAGYALRRWREKRTLPWLVASLRHARHGSQGVEELVAAAARVESSKPGFVMASFHRLHLMVDGGLKAQARAELDELLKQPLPESSINLFRGLRMRTAIDLTDFLNFASRMPVMLTTNLNAGEVPPLDDWEKTLVARAIGQNLFDRDSVKILNERTPMRLLRQAALGGALPPYTERDFILSAFTRALLLDDFENGQPLAARLGEIGADSQGYLETYKRAQTTEDRRFAGIFYILHHPESRPYLSSGMGRLGRPERIDDYRDNWWCPVDIAVELDARTNGSEFEGPLPAREDPDSPAWSTAFLSEKDRREAALELARIARTQSGPDYLIRETMRYARAHLNDPRVPEALHYALRSQRYGCVREQTAAAAEQAWKYLWRRYPKNPWTRKSNYPFQPDNLPRPGIR